MSFQDTARKLFWHLGLDVKRRALPGSSLGLTLNLLEFSAADLVLDIGANEGQFALELLSYRPDQRIISFEPGSEAHTNVSSRAKRHPSWTVADQAALGATQGTSTLYLTQNSQCASLRKVAEASPKLGDAFSATGVEEVRVERLDQIRLPPLESAKNIYLKMDVQGFEDEVFQGAAGLLPRIAAIQVEISTIEVYRGQSSGLSSLDPFLKAGFAIYGFSNGWRDKDTGRLIQFDAFLIRNDG